MVKSLGNKKVNGIERTETMRLKNLIRPVNFVRLHNTNGKPTIQIGECTAGWRASVQLKEQINGTEVDFKN
jgi:hypothetical protein